MGVGTFVSAAFTKMEQDVDGTTWRIEHGLESQTKDVDMFEAATKAGIGAKNDADKQAETQRATTSAISGLARSLAGKAKSAGLSK